LPAGAVGAITRFLQDGGDLLALGLPGWAAPTFKLGGRWLTRSEYEQALATQKPQRVLIDFGKEDLAQWTRHTSSPGTAATRASVPAEGITALHVVVENLTGWDTLASPSLADRFPPNHSLTCFRAKGTPATHQLAVEWVEQDGSRWIATVDLAPEWRDYALPPEAFQPWQPPPGRGSPGDCLNTRRLARLTVGLALTHTAVETGRHEYWLAQVGSGPNPFGEAAPPVAPVIPRLESFAPAYQCFPITTPVEVKRRAPWHRLGDQPPSEGAFPELAANAAVALHPRPRGVGFAQERPWRWEPVLAAYDPRDGDYRGAIGGLVAHVRGPYRGSVWGLFTPASPQFYQSAAVKGEIQALLRQMKRGVFFQEAGGEFFTVFPKQPVRLGARVVNFSRAATDGLRVKAIVVDRQNSATLLAQDWSLSLGAGETRAVETTWQPPAGPTEGWEVRVSLFAGNAPLDQLSHELNLWQPKARPHFVSARQGQLWQAGQTWKAHGVNYMPSSGIGVANEYFEHWLDRGAYDPEVIQRDLERIKRMNMNAVSVFVYYRALAAQHLLDLLFRCERLGLKVNQSLRPGTPMDFRWNEMKALIEHYRMAENDTILAYDLAWEPSHYDYRYQQRHYAGKWGQWVQKQHGSVEAAEKAWGVPAPRPEPPQDAPAGPATPLLAVPTMRQLTQDGAWRKLAADYRAFLDDLLGQNYAEARRLVRTVDAHHLVSFRMQHAGDPTYNSEGMLPYDFYGLSQAVDLWEPEGYGRIGDWERVKPGHFTAAYARLCDAAKPLVWAEMGFNTWDMRLMAPEPRKLEFAARFYADFYRMLRESGADGVLCWWYPGGFRLNEKSDFGIINPDGADRAITRVIREEGPRFLAASKPGAPDYWITVDRERDARGLCGIYEAVRDEYWRAVESGRKVGLRWARRPGTR
jgi:hypothetical protein